MAAQWEFERIGLNGGASGNAYKNIFNATGKTAGEKLSREAIQNSVDASKQSEDNQEVRVDFRFVQLEGTARQQFEEIAKFDSIRERVDLLGLEPNNALIKQNGPLNLLYIDDYETTGLNGNPEEESSKLRLLLMDLGGSDKASLPESSGGSYGFGKAAYSAISRLGMIFAYSPTYDKNEKPIHVLMGCTYSKGYKHHDVRYSGRAFFGNSDIVDGEGTRYDPIRNEEAIKIADRLGFKRESNGFGTSLLMVDVGVKPVDVLYGIEKWWWPRLQSGRLEATVVDFQQKEWIPRPKCHKFLRPFIDAFSCVEKKTPDSPENLKLKTFQRVHDKQLGSLGLAVVSSTSETDRIEEIDEEDQLTDKVALIRSPLMVVDYFQKWRSDKTEVVGCFVAHSDIDNLLRLSEPPDHSRWDAEADRLQRSNLEPEVAKDIVYKVLRRIKGEFTAFRKTARPPPPPQSKRPERLSRELAKWFGIGQSQVQPKPLPNPAPISLQIPQQSLTLVDGKLVASGGLKLRISDAQLESLDIEVRIELQVAEEDEFSANDPIPLKQTTDGEFKQGEDLVWRGSIYDSQVVSFSYESEPYDDDWTVRLLSNVRPIEQA